MRFGAVGGFGIVVFGAVWLILAVLGLDTAGGIVLRTVRLFHRILSFLNIRNTGQVPDGSLIPVEHSISCRL